MKFKPGDIVRVDRQSDDDPLCVEYHELKGRVIRTVETQMGTRVVRFEDLTSHRVFVFREQDLEEV